MLGTHNKNTIERFGLNGSGQTSWSFGFLIALLPGCLCITQPKLGTGFGKAFKNKKLIKFI